MFVAISFIVHGGFSKQTVYDVFLQDQDNLQSVPVGKVLCRSLVVRRGHEHSSISQLSHCSAKSVGDNKSPGLNLRIIGVD